MYLQTLNFISASADPCILIMLHVTMQSSVRPMKKYQLYSCDSVCALRRPYLCISAPSVLLSHQMHVCILWHSWTSIIIARRWSNHFLTRLCEASVCSTRASINAFPYLLNIVSNYMMWGCERAGLSVCSILNELDLWITFKRIVWFVHTQSTLVGQAGI